MSAPFGGERGNGQDGSIAHGTDRLPPRGSSTYWRPRPNDSPIMKRDPVLQGLSREHHDALALAMIVTRHAGPEAAASPTKQTLEALRELTLAFWRGALVPHFRAEEEVLLPAYVRACAGEIDDGVRQVLVEHQRLRAYAQELQSATTGDDDANLRHTLAGFATLLAAHARREDREVFGTIESALDATVLDSLGEQLPTGTGPDGDRLREQLAEWMRNLPAR